MRLNADMLFAAAAQIAESLRIIDPKGDYKNVELKMHVDSGYVLRFLALNFNLSRVHFRLKDLGSGEDVWVNTEANDEWPNYVAITLSAIPAKTLVNMVTFT